MVVVEADDEDGCCGLAAFVPVVVSDESLRLEQSRSESLGATPLLWSLAKTHLG